MITLRIIDTNNNNYFPQKIENLSFKNIHYGGNSELNFKLNEDPSFQNHKVKLFNNLYLYYFSKLIWQGYITEFQRDYKNLNYNLRASGLLSDLINKRIKKTYVLDDIGDFKNWNEINRKESQEILYGYSQARDEKGVKISLLQRNYSANEEAVFEIKIDENIERLKARIFMNQPNNFWTSLITLDENHSNPNTEKNWGNVQKVDEDVIIDISNVGINKRYLQFRVRSTSTTAITNDRYFSQLENLKLLTSDNEINASNILKDLLINHTQKLDLDTSLIQDCYNVKNIDRCESLDYWTTSDNSKVALSLENTIVKEGNSSIKAIITTYLGQYLLRKLTQVEEIYNFDFASDDGNWILYNADITGGVLNITANYGSGIRYADDDWLIFPFEGFEIEVDFKQDSVPASEGMQINIYLSGDEIPIIFDLQKSNNTMRISYDGVLKASQAFTQDVSWHTVKIRRGGIGAPFYFSIDSGTEISWSDYPTTGNFISVSLMMDNCTGEFDNFKYKNRAPWSPEDLQSKNLIKFWIYSSVTGNVLKTEIGENERYQFEPDWTCRYKGKQKPQNATPVWTHTGTDYGSVSGGILTINKTGANECRYKREDAGHNVKGNTIITKMKCNNAAKTTLIQIYDGIATSTIAIYSNKIEDWNDSANSYTVDMTQYRELWLTMKNNFWILYVDGIFALCGETTLSADNRFNFGMDGSANLGQTYWDYVYYYNLGFLRNKRMEKTISVSTANIWEEKVIDLNNLSIETRDAIKYLKFKTLQNCTLYIDWIKSNFELTSAYYRDRTAPLNILEDVLAYQDYEWTITKDRKVKFFEVDRDEIDYICPIKNLVFEENSTSYFSKIYLVYFDEMMQRQEIELTDENSKIPFIREHVIGLGGISDVGAKAIGEAQFSFHKKPRYQVSCSIGNFVFDKNGGRINPVEIEPNNNVKFLGIPKLPIFRIIRTDYANDVCRLTLETEEESTPNIMKSIIGVL